MATFAPFWTQPYSQPSQLYLVGALHEKDDHGHSVSIQKIYAHQEIIIGRDANRCQHVVHDAAVSNKHLRIYTIVFDVDQSDGVAPLVYAEDLSRNGTYWNGSLIGKGNGGVLLSDGDTLRISPRIYYHFRQSGNQIEAQSFDLTQECEMKHFEKEYNVSDRKLGAGACGAVFMAIEQSSRTQVACKIIDLRKLKFAPQEKIGELESAAAADDVDSQVEMAKIRPWAERKQKENRLEQQLRIYHREASILASLRHPNIIGIEKVYITDHSIYIFQDLVTGGDLFSFLERKNGKLSDVEAAVIVRQILIALEYLHDQNIVHRDLKPENILMTSLSNGCRVVLTDFGHAKKIENERTRMTTMAGTDQYIAPEISGSSRHFPGKIGYTKAVDMWSLGCITVVLLTGGSPFMSPRTNQYCQKLAQACDLQQLDHVAEWHFVGKRPKDFVRQLLVLDEEQRMNAKDAKKHWWFSNNFHKLDFEDVYQRATKHWRPRTLKSPVIEMIDTNQLNELSMLRQSSLFGQRNHRRRSPMPVDPPYKPYPRRMSLSLLPKRRPGFAGVLSDEVRTAIRDKWSPGRRRPPTVSPGEDEVPALMPDTEADELDRPGDGTDPEDAREKSAVRGARPSFMSTSMSPSMSSLRLLVEKQSSTVQTRAAKTATASDYPQVKARERKVVRRPSSASISSAAPSTGRRSPQFGKREISLAIRGDAAAVEDTLWTTRANKAEVRTRRADADVAMLDGKVTFHRTKDELALEKSSRLPTDGTDYQSHKPAAKEALGMRDFRQRPCMPIHSSFEDLRLMAAERPSVHTALRTLERRNAPSKLRSPLHSVRTRSRQPSNMKRRRGSIYDLDSDEESEQKECGLGSLSLDPETTDFRPRTAWKKTKRQID